MTRYLRLAAALAGAADTGQFLVARRHLFRENRRRAAGTAAGVALWSALALSVLAERRAGRRTLALASTVALSNAALLIVHVRSRPLRSRVFLGPALAATVLGLVLVDHP